MCIREFPQIPQVQVNTFCQLYSAERASRSTITITNDVRFNVPTLSHSADSGGLFVRLLLRLLSELLCCCFVLGLFGLWDFCFIFFLLLVTVVVIVVVLLSLGFVLLFLWLVGGGGGGVGSLLLLLFRFCFSVCFCSALEVCGEMEQKKPSLWC